MSDEMSLVMLLLAVALFPLLYRLLSRRHFQARTQPAQHGVDTVSQA